MPVVHGTMGCGQESYKASVAVPPAPVRVPSQRPLAPSVANGKGDNEMSLGAVLRSSGICLTAKENPRKPQLGDRLMKAVRPVIALNGVPYLQMRSVGSHSLSGRNGRDRTTTVSNQSFRCH